MIVASFFRDETVAAAVAATCCNGCKNEAVAATVGALASCTLMFTRCRLTHPVSLEKVDHAVAIVKQSRVQVVGYDVTSAGHRTEVDRDFTRKTVGHFVCVVVVLVIRVALE